jgi:hypothetical protein
MSILWILILDPWAVFAVLFLGEGRWWEDDTALN